MVFDNEIITQKRNLPQIHVSQGGFSSVADKDKPTYDIMPANKTVGRMFNRKRF